jgi:hypothetical protein
LDAIQTAVHKDVLQQRARDVFIGSQPMLSENFLKQSWEILGNFVHWNKSNPLLQRAVKTYPDLLPRCYFILTASFDAFGYMPTKLALAKDFIGMLNDDLVETELRVCEYAKTKKGIFSGLSHVMPMIREMYGTEHFCLDVLPPTPHHAYVIFVLNHKEKIRTGVSLEELFGILAVHDSQLRKIFSLIASSGYAK